MVGIKGDNILHLKAFKIKMRMEDYITFQLLDSLRK